MVPVLVRGESPTKMNWLPSLVSPPGRLVVIDVGSAAQPPNPNGLHACASVMTLTPLPPNSPMYRSQVLVWVPHTKARPPRTPRPSVVRPTISVNCCDGSRFGLVMRMIEPPRTWARYSLPSTGLSAMEFVRPAEPPSPRMMPLPRTIVSVFGSKVTRTAPGLLVESSAMYT